MMVQMMNARDEIPVEFPMYVEALQRESSFLYDTSTLVKDSSRDSSTRCSLRCRLFKLSCLVKLRQAKASSLRMSW